MGKATRAECRQKTLDLVARLGGGISLEMGKLTGGKYLRPVGIAMRRNAKLYIDWL